MTKLSIDVIGQLILDTRLHFQTEKNILGEAIVSQIDWIPQGRLDKPWEGLNPAFPLVMLWNNWKMDNYISRILEERFAAHDKFKGKARNVMDLALEGYRGTEQKAPPQMDRQFKKNAICQVKTFLFAGHDTVSGTLAYTFHLLSKSPDKMAKIREEHDRVFGSNPDDAEELIRSKPVLLNKLEYTLAVIKETLRLYPPASTMRAGHKGLFIRDPKTGKSWPTEHFMVSPTTIGMHRHADLFPQPHKFLPERFLEKGSYPGYLPFSKGPRSCIGQDLAIIESKVILVLTLRKFNIRACYEGLRSLRGDGSSWPGEENGVQEVWGDEAYQVMQGFAKPREGLPARVSLRN